MQHDLAHERYLDDARAKERAAIIELCKRPDSDVKARGLLMGYAKEAMRLQHGFLLPRLLYATGRIPLTLEAMS